MTKSFKYFQQKHPVFYYDHYSLNVSNDSLKFSFDFRIEPDIRFSPKTEILGVDKNRIALIKKEVLNNLAFHLGLIEMLSYWKVSCSPQIVVQAGYLDYFQVSWWRSLILNGMGEYFYRNGIDCGAPDFVNISSVNKDSCCAVALYEDDLDSEGYLIPIGGGKDSALSCELVKKANKNTACWSLNPTTAMLETANISGNKESIIVNRVIDKKLLRMNEDGYLNGHTPFSAYLAFAASAGAILFDKKNVAVSNERSSNEGNLFFNKREINHQYSKSFDFEKKFRDYSSRYLAPELNYFSLLRPLYEIQIARLFSGYPKYFQSFLSCNKGQKTGKWCCRCPKCLFTFTILYPFVDEQVLVRDIFQENLFYNKNLAQIAFDMIGFGAAKPFECVGAFEETCAAFCLCVKKAEKGGNPLPALLRLVYAEILKNERNPEDLVDKFLNAWNDQRFIPDDMEKLMRAELNMA